MAQSLTLDWLMENEQRSYPLLNNMTRLSDNGAYVYDDKVLLDAQLFYNDTAQLLRINVVDDVVHIYTSGGKTFTFDKTVDFPQYSRISSGDLLVVGAELKNIPNGDYVFSSIYFEPAIVFEFDGPWLGVLSITVNSSTLTGEVKFKEGYQIDITTNSQIITIGANNVMGLPIDCTTFSTGTSCDNIVSFINGVSSADNKINIIAGPGVTILDDPDNHRIYVGFSFSSVDDICKNIPY
jgi:hypothetical protein